MIRGRIYWRISRTCCALKGTLPDLPHDRDAVIQCLTCGQWWRSIQNRDYPYWRKCSPGKAERLIKRWNRHDIVDDNLIPSEEEMQNND